MPLVWETDFSPVLRVSATACKLTCCAWCASSELWSYMEQLTNDVMSTSDYIHNNVSQLDQLIHTPLTCGLVSHTVPPPRHLHWPHSTWPTTVFWPQLCAVDDICGPLTPWNWWCSGQRPSSAPGPFAVAAAWNRLPADIRTFRHLHRNWKLFMPAGASEDFFFILRGRNWLIIIIIIISITVNRTTSDFSATAELVAVFEIN